MSSPGETPVHSTRFSHVPMIIKTPRIQRGISSQHERGVGTTAARLRQGDVLRRSSERPSAATVAVNCSTICSTRRPGATTVGGRPRNRLSAVRNSPYNGFDLSWWSHLPPKRNRRLFRRLFAGLGPEQPEGVLHTHPPSPHVVSPCTRRDAVGSSLPPRSVRGCVGRCIRTSGYPPSTHSGE